MKKYLKIFPAFALAVAAGVFGHTVITAQAGNPRLSFQKQYTLRTEM